MLVVSELLSRERGEDRSGAEEERKEDKEEKREE